MIFKVCYDVDCWLVILLEFLGDDYENIFCYCYGIIYVVCSLCVEGRNC